MMDTNLMPVPKVSVLERVSHINNESREQLFNLEMSFGHLELNL